MTPITQLLEAANRGDLRAAAELLPLVYDELRKLATAKMKHEKPGQTLNATALVHEAYLRLVASPGPQSGEVSFQGRGHFFAAAAEAMRRILVDQARMKNRHKRRGNRQAIDLSDLPERVEHDPDLILTLDEVLTRLSQEDSSAGDVAKLHLFAEMSIEEAAIALGLSRATAYRQWTYARAWLQDAISKIS